MGRQATCQHCGEAYVPVSLTCPHCAGAGEYPNVFLANQERPALLRRYQTACNQASRQGVDLLLQALQKAVEQKSQACINRDYLEIRRLIKGGSAYASYYQQIKAGLRLLTDDKWEESRERVDTLFFPGFKEEMLFAALTLDDRGIFYYGACCLILKETMIQKRATLFHENTVQFVIKNSILISDSAPEGFRAVWLDRGLLAVAKAAEDVSPSTTEADFPQLLVWQDPTQEGEDIFIEIHIYGSLTIQSAKKITFPASPLKGMKTEANRLEQELKARKIPYQRI